MLRQPTLRRVRQKPSDYDVGPESRQRARLDEASVRQRDAVIDEIPVGGASETDIWLEDDEATSTPEQAPRNGELLDDRVRTREVLEVVADEDDVEVIDWHAIGERQPVALDERDV